MDRKEAKWEEVRNEGEKGRGKGRKGVVGGKTRRRRKEEKRVGKTKQRREVGKD